MAWFISELLFRMALIDAHACAVCGYGTGKSQEAFLLTTGILTLIPLFMIGGIAFYVHRSMK